MDIISVTETALTNVYLTLQRLRDDSEIITLKSEQHLSQLLTSLDESFRRDIQQYLETINKLKEKLKYCIDENMVAIIDRLNKLPDYEKSAYKKTSYNA